MTKEQQEQFREEAENYAFRVPYDGSNKFYNEDRFQGYLDGRSKSVKEIARLEAELEALKKDNEELKAEVKWQEARFFAFFYNQDQANQTN